MLLLLRSVVLRRWMFSWCYCAVVAGVSMNGRGWKREWRTGGWLEDGWRVGVPPRWRLRPHHHHTSPSYSPAQLSWRTLQIWQMYLSPFPASQTYFPFAQLEAWDRYSVCWVVWSHFLDDWYLFPSEGWWWGITIDIYIGLAPLSGSDITRHCISTTQDFGLKDNIYLISEWLCCFILSVKFSLTNSLFLNSYTFQERRHSKIRTYSYCETWLECVKIFLPEKRVFNASICP